MRRLCSIASLYIKPSVALLPPYLYQYLSHRILSSFSKKKTYVVHELSPGLIQNAFYVPAALNFFSFVQKSSSPSMLGSSRSGRYRRPSPSHRPWPISISDGGRRCHVNRHVSLFGQSSWLLLRILHRFLVGASHN